MNDRKLKFIRAVRLLAPHDRLILQFAETVPTHSLPLHPGGAALELVAALQRLRPATLCPRRSGLIGRARWAYPVMRR